jgi:hypothetical protein
MVRHAARWQWVVGAWLVAAAVVTTGCSDDDVDRGRGGTAGATTGTGTGAGATGGSGGTATVPESPDVTKFDLLGAGAGGALHDAVCAAHELPPGCDVCEALGHYGDLECDSALIDAGLCVGPDPDCQASAADYYVATDGDDGADGSESAPFATIQRAHDAVGPGDRIYVRGGTYAPTESTQFRAEGTVTEPIELVTYPGEAVVIDAEGLPEGDTEGASTATWHFLGAKHWRIHGPLHLTHGRGSGVVIEEDTQDVAFSFVESSYNGQTASRAGHGFLIVEDEWADAQDIRFVNCDAHHNANHRTRTGEDVAENLYQHGDGWRIKSGQGIVLVGCRSWHNLDDNYDLVWATAPVLLHQCWSAFAGRDDGPGSITGTPDFAAAWGEGIKLGYLDDTGPHRAVRCLSWKNVDLGYRMDGGPYALLHCASFENGRRALGWELGPSPHELHNNLDFGSPNETPIPATTTSDHNSWDAASGFTVAADDFESVDDGALLGPRTPDGSLPVVPFMRLVPTSDLVDAGLDVGIAYGGTAPDVGCFERL